jgi:hypothetical protein
MLSREEVPSLSERLQVAAQEYGDAPLRLEINDTTFRSATKQRWAESGWTISSEEANEIMDGNEVVRRAALLKLLQGQGVTEIVFLRGADVINVVNAAE